MSLRKNLQFEQLEQRQLLSVSANSPAEHVAAPYEYTGVFRSRSLDPAHLNAFSGAVLLPDGKHVLTAAHVAPSLGRSMETDLPAPNNNFVTQSRTLHPDYPSVDLAIYELAQELDPKLFERYDIYRDNDEIGQVAIRVGFGFAGEDTVEIQNDGIKRIGVNRYGNINRPWDLEYDFDNDTTSEDVLGDGPGIHGGKLSEVIAATRDSGSPAFIDGKIAGITHFGIGLGELAHNEEGTDTRVSFAAAWIDSITDEAGNPQVSDVTISGSNSLHAPYSFAYEMENNPNWIPGHQLKTVPVGGADTVAIEFSEHVLNVDANSLLLKELTTGHAPQLAATGGFSYDVGTHTATWTFDSPFDADQHHISISDTVTDVGGNRLDGNWSNPFSVTTTNSSVSTFSSGGTSGNGSAGDDFTFVFSILPGDANQDNIVNGADFLVYQDHRWLGGVNNPFVLADYTGDGRTNFTDRAFWDASYGRNLRDLIFADFNQDGVVNTLDFTILASPGNYASSGDRSRGDADNDGYIGSHDFFLLVHHFSMQLDWVL